MVTAPVFKLKPTVQTYDWGKIGRESKVAQLAEAGKAADFTLDESKPYAEVRSFPRILSCRDSCVKEMWMGTHPTSPSYVHGLNIPLKDHLAANTHLIGAKVADEFKAQDGNVPFLFKVLSIHKALSIQTHPDKATAEKLHAEQPHIYKGMSSFPSFPSSSLSHRTSTDNNHKPEMALAITPFTALCGFRPLSEIATFLGSTPELSALVPRSIAAKFVALASTSTPEGPDEKAALRDVFAAVMTAEEPVVKTQLAALVQRYKTSGGVNEEERDVVELVITLNEQFPGDIGIFCAYLLNYIKLQPGEAIFLGAGEPHAYVSGGRSFLPYYDELIADT
jgi:mannose-6-phosphate isomerase